MTMLEPPVSSLSDRAGAGGSEAPLISVVVPVYKEEHSIRPFLERTVPVLERLGTYEIVFCQDPSPDRTEAVIREEIAHNPHIGLLVFSRRFGQPAATMAGILNCRGQWCVVIDVDLQDPPEAIDSLYRKALDGFDVVTARRASREGETLVKRVVSDLGYRVMNEIAEVPIPRNTGDFRLINRKVIEELRGLSESHGYLRGLVSLVGFSHGEILYERNVRHAGAGNYNRYFGSFKIGINGIIGFSTFPLQIMMWAGFAIALLSALAIFIVVALKIWHGEDYPMGIPTITVLLLFIGGVQLAAVGVLGEYVGRIYDEVRRRPLYIVDRAVNVTVRDPRGPRSGSQANAHGGPPMSTDPPGRES
jgi:glycosyltransferase involved in cell wall biosynthesis